MWDNWVTDRTRLIVSVILLAAITAAVGTLAVSGHLWPLLRQLWDLFQSKDQMRAYVESWGTLAPIVFIAIQSLQVVLAPIPGEVTGAVGGFIFGGLPNLIYSTVGLTAGSVIAFWAAKIIGLPLVKLVVSEKTIEKFHFVTERRGVVLTWLLFVIPGFPKDILSYLLGLSPMRFMVFLPVCALGRIPGTVLLSYGGSALYDENWLLLGIVFVGTLVGFGVLFIYRDHIQRLLAAPDGETVPRTELRATSEDT